MFSQTGFRTSLIALSPMFMAAKWLIKPDVCTGRGSAYYHFAEKESVRKDFIPTLLYCHSELCEESINTKWVFTDPSLMFRMTKG